MSIFKMILSWIPGWKKEEEKQRTINEIRDGKSVRIIVTDWKYNISTSRNNTKDMRKENIHTVSYLHFIFSHLLLFSE